MDVDRPGQRPLEQVAAELRLLASALDHDSVPGAQRDATVLAYDLTLAEACVALRLDERLESARRRGEAVRERTRVEQALAEAGLEVRPR